MQPTSRHAYIDWLRILAILGVLFFHAAMPFAAEEDWHIRNKETSNVLLEFNYWLSRFRMPLLFFISGVVSFYMMQKRSALSFIGLRFRRLFIPLLFGMLVIVPPQVYMERLTQGFTGSYFEFYPSIFQGKPYPEGNTSWHHLWFIAYLFVYDLVAAPLFAWMASAKAKNFIQRLSWLAKGRRIYLLMIPSIIVYASLVLQFPRTDDLIHDYTYLPYWFFFLLMGFICISNTALMESLERNRRSSLLLGLLLFAGMNYMRWNNLEPWDIHPGTWQNNPWTYGYLAMIPAMAWTWIFAITGYGKKYLNRKTAFSNYATQAVYPFYIVHQTVIVILAYYVVRANDVVFVKYLFLAFVSLFASVAICHLLIQPYNITRFLFGMKPKQDPQVKHTQSAITNAQHATSPQEPSRTNIQPEMA
ncbi:MAG TPA: acyltransferase family protein [Chitinophagaceae bacterium]|nr:acyltransferase family protein [Chitinophagaceae bacterium]